MRFSQSFLSLFPPPHYLRMSTVALVIGDESVELLEFGRPLKGRFLNVKRFERFSLPHDAVQGGFVNDEYALKAIFENVAALGFRYVNVTLPEERSYLFAATIDKVAPESLHDAIAFILEENVPLKLTGAIFETRIVGEIAPDKLRASVSVLSRKSADFFDELLRGTDLIPLSFNLESESTAQAVVQRGDATPQLIVKFGDAKTGLYVVANEIVQFSTTVPYAAATRLEDMKAELRKLFDFWNGKMGEGGATSKIAKVIVCGKVPADQSIKAELAAATGLPWNEAYAWINVSVEEAALPRELTENTVAHATAIGAALAGPERLFRLLPAGALKAASAEYGRRRWAIAWMALTLSFFLALGGIFWPYYLAQTRLEEAQAEKTNLQDDSSAEAAMLRSWYVSERAKLAALSPLADRQEAAAAVGDAIREKAPGVELTSFTWSSLQGGNPASLSLVGTASDRATLLTFESLLNGTGAYQDVGLPLESLAKDKDIPFQMKLVPKPLP